MTGSHLAAVLLAALGAVLFGLAAVRQHGAVQDATAAHPVGAGLSLRTLGRLVRQPSWLVGAVQGGVAGGAHVVALALAPITLVQPIGVLAVPVTVVVSALRSYRRPSRAQLLGSVSSVLGIAVLTVLLLAPATEEVQLPGWGLETLVVGGAVSVTVLGGLVRRGPPLVRCVGLAVGAAVLFGLNSILIRTLSHLVGSHTVSAQPALFLVALLGIVVALPVGLWAMQLAYLSGPPQVVICTLTLVDPLAAVVGGYLLLHDGVAVQGATLAAAFGCVAVAVLGVLLLARDYPAELPGAARPAAEGTSASSR